MHIRKPENKGTLYLGSNEDINSGKGLNKIEARCDEGKSKTKSLKIKQWKCQNVKGKLNNMKQVLRNG